MDKHRIYIQQERKLQDGMKISITSTKKKRILNLGKNTVSGGYKFTIYKKGKKKAIKTIKVTGNANAKTAKMPKQKRNILYQNLKAYKENKWNV